MRVLLLFFGLLMPLGLLAQENKHQDSIPYLEEVSVYAQSIKDHLVGNKITYPTTEQIRMHKNAHLGELLQEQAAIHLKMYGNGMLSSIAFRGTTASQTSVRWNNFNINNYTLGQTDFSTLPVAAIDEFIILPGSGSSFGGNGAIGGSIALNNITSFKKAKQYYLKQSIASFGTYSTQAGLTISNDRFYHQSKIYIHDSENDFYIAETQSSLENAHHKNYGLSQQWGFKIDENNTLELSNWFHFNDREIQQAIGARASSIPTPTQEDENLRIALNYTGTFDQWSIKAGTAYFRDRMQYYDGSVNNLFLVNRSESFIEWATINRKSFNWTTYSRLNLIEAKSPGFSNSRVNEARFTYGFKGEGSFFTKFRYAFNIRQQLVTNTGLNPISPYLGLQYDLMKKEGLGLKLKANTSYNYRVPTLNDRFWQVEERVNIDSEQAINTEIGIELLKYSQKFSWKSEANIFRNHIYDLIQWVPFKGISRPENVDEVLVHGIELQNNVKYRHQNNLEISGLLAYSYTRSIPIIGSQQSFDQQLVYVPKHKGSANLNLKLFHTQLSYQYTFTSRVYTTEGNSEAFSIPAFAVHDLMLSQSWNDLDLIIKLNNLFNTTYQTYLNYAMPGRNYELTINYTINK